MSDLSTLSVGDKCWMLNGIRNRSFLCKVVSMDNVVLTVANLDKDDKLFSFEIDTGNPVGDYIPFGSTRPTIVHYTDPDAQRLDLERVHRSYRDDIGRLLAEMPNNREGWDEAAALLEEWRSVPVDE